MNYLEPLYTFFFFDELEPLYTYYVYTAALVKYIESVKTGEEMFKMALHTSNNTVVSLP